MSSIVRETRHSVYVVKSDESADEKEDLLSPLQGRKLRVVELRTKEVKEDSEVSEYYSCTDADVENIAPKKGSGKRRSLKRKSFETNNEVNESSQSDTESHNKNIKEKRIKRARKSEEFVDTTIKDEKKTEVACDVTSEDQVLPDSTVSDFSIEGTTNEGINDKSEVESINQQKEKCVESVSQEKDEQKSVQFALTVEKKESKIPLRPTSAVKKTPNFAKIHAKNFKKMESLREYYDRKGKGKAKLRFTPTAVKKMETPLKSSSSILAEPEKKKNVFTFGTITTPATGARKKLTASTIKKTPAMTFGMNVSSLSTSKKSTFNLQDSLKKPLGYKPYAGKIKPVPLVPLQTQRTNLVKKPNIASRDEIRSQSRVEIRGVRSNKRFDLLMSRRGIN